MESSLHSVASAARRFGVSPFTVRRLIEAGDLKAVHVGARLLIPTQEIERVVTHGAGQPRTRKRLGGDRRQRR